MMAAALRLLPLAVAGRICRQRLWSVCSAQRGRGTISHCPSAAAVRDAPHGLNVQSFAAAPIPLCLIDGQARVVLQVPPCDVDGVLAVCASQEAHVFP
jgi:hypothetical protein